MLPQPALKNYSAGFTFVELLVVLAMVSIIVSLSMINLTGLISSTTLDDSLELLVSDIKRQQLRGMTGELSQDTSVYGIHFESDSYVLFAGETYVPGSAANTTVNLPNGQEFSSIQLHEETIVFVPQAGSVLNHNPEADTVTLRSTASNESVQIEFNALGVIQVL